MLVKKRYWLAIPLFSFLLVSGILVTKPAAVISRLYSSEQISAVKLSPSLYKGSPITIVGKVTEYKDHFGIPAFRVADQTGDIMVFCGGSTIEVPQVGSFVVTTGSIEEINLMGAKMAVVMRESKRLFSWGGKSKTIIKSNTL